MKIAYLNNGGSITVDLETEEIGSLESCREAISRIYLIKEPMRLVFKEGDRNEEYNVVEGDIVIKFYDNDFKKKIIVVKSKEWAENIIEYEKTLQEKREQWAKEKADTASICKECEVSTPNCEA